LGVVAQFIKRKGHDYLLEALPEIIQTFPEVKVLFFGQGPLEHSLRQTVSRYGLKDTVTFAGFRRDLETILPCLRIIVHPATMEGLGVCLLQAASAGVPIVAFASGGIPEIVHHEDNGLLVAPGESHSLAVAIRTILGNPDLARKMGRNGQRLVRQRFSIEAMVKKNTSVYRQVLGIDG
jgi:glycosyltransferase involved in cell wall biosynthesis